MKINILRWENLGVGMKDERAMERTFIEQPLTPRKKACPESATSESDSAASIPHYLMLDWSRSPRL